MGSYPRQGTAGHTRHARAQAPRRRLRLATITARVSAAFNACVPKGRANPSPSLGLSARLRGAHAAGNWRDQTTRQSPAAIEGRPGLAQRSQLTPTRVRRRAR
jgi:hypothetical protein